MGIWEIDVLGSKENSQLAEGGARYFLLNPDENEPHSKIWAFADTNVTRRTKTVPSNTFYTKRYRWSFSEALQTWADLPHGIAIFTFQQPPPRPTTR